MTDQKFEIKNFVSEMQREFSKIIQNGITDFQSEITKTNEYDSERLAKAIRTLEKKLERSLKLSTDKVEKFHKENTQADPDNKYYQYVLKLEDDSSGHRSNSEKRKITEVWKALKETCKDYKLKKQEYNKYYMYEKFLEREKKVVEALGNLSPSKVEGQFKRKIIFRI